MSATFPSCSSISWGSLPMEVSIYTAAELRSQWLAALEHEAGEGAAIELDGSAVEQFDAAGAQSLLALAHALSARGQRLRVTRASDALVHACRALGLGDMIASTVREPG
ncbi:STAS domain-containing protein [Roseateles sp. NT4]|uniref:STAS domain-containing protein n=1 Tax=Roseateles sp. NT4 TaxID=3453715 RepID=UPI003EE84F79